MARGEPAEPRTNLPAPYRSPWIGLAEALQGLLAALALKLRELWRRNHQASLPLPRFWPRSLAALFWPLLLVLALLALALLLTLALPATRPPGAAPGSAASAGAQAPPVPLPAATAASAPVSDPAPRRPQAQQQASQAGPATAAQPIPTPPPTGSNEPPGGSMRAPEPPFRPRGDQATPEPAPTLQLDPLLALLSDPEDRDLLQAAQPDPAIGLLRLRLSEPAVSLSDRSLLQRAGGWQQRAREAGYDKLELLAADGSLLARQALVGSGMILLAPSPSQP